MTDGPEYTQETVNSLIRIDCAESFEWGFHAGYHGLPVDIQWEDEASYKAGHCAGIEQSGEREWVVA